MPLPLIVAGVLGLLLFGIGVSQADKIAKHARYRLNWFAMCVCAMLLFVGACFLLPPTL